MISQKDLDRLRATHHVIPPIDSLDVVPKGFGVIARSVRFSTKPEDRECFVVDDGLALSNIALRRLDKLAGLVWKQTTILFDPKSPYVCEARAEALYQDLDGTWRNATASRIVNLTDGSPETARWSQARLFRARANISALAETLAKSKVRRELLSIRPSYKPEELEKPFAVLRLVPAIDFSSPDISMMIAQEFIKSSSALFGSAPSVAAPSPGPVYSHHQEEPRITSPSEVSEIDDWDTEDEIEAVAPDPPRAASEATVAAQASAERPAVAERTVVPPTADESIKPKLIELAADLYKRKVPGGRSPKKPPLTDLTVEELEAIIQYLEKRPDLK